MNPSNISTISMKMESMSMTTHDRVVRNNKRLPQSRYSPYTLGTTEKKKQKEEVFRLGVELSLYVAEAMLLVSDDIRSLLLFGTQLIMKFTGEKDNNIRSQVVERLIVVMLYVFETYIKPKNGVYQADGKSTQLELINACTQHFAYGVRNLERIVLVFRNGGIMPPSDLEDYNQELKKLEEKLRSCKDVSEANGFAREIIKS
ncbi:PREDICTED: uncharacterized protein LOC104757836 isoform X2 [Camelina sativa]|uniref:Uncharacterized protein LOC104757836 isoform X2 n=1 Tax=Camelina sativa TaxID=90675 RepID=A0ABM0X0R2_CAMSA|nr:PREDICTED: uncharacterized protein LOC104757836 isoform X2 [Camelina sativa]XP_019094274.1 PREDICTED: uncharacterized protein LOC104757836 isoform X2 [Camelina sativa]